MQSTVKSGAQECGLAPAFLLSSSWNYRANREVRMGPTTSAFWVPWQGAEPRRLGLCGSSGAAHDLTGLCCLCSGWEVIFRSLPFRVERILGTT